MALILIFHNKTHLAPISDYDVKVLVGDGTPARSKVLYTGEVCGHPRKESWQALVRRLLKDLPDPEAAE